MQNGKIIWSFWLPPARYVLFNEDKQPTEGYHKEVKYLFLLRSNLSINYAMSHFEILPIWYKNKKHFSQSQNYENKNIFSQFKLWSGKKKVSKFITEFYSWFDPIVSIAVC